MAFPGGPRPGNTPPNYNPNLLADNMQNLQINRPNQPPSRGNLNPNAPRQPTPFGQQPPPFAGATPVSRPGPPPPGVFPRAPVPTSGPPQSTFPSNVAVSRPTGPPPMTQAPQPFASRPPPPGVVPSMSGSPMPPPPGTVPSIAGSSVPPPPNAVPPAGLGPHPGPPTSVPAFQPSSTYGLTSNGPPAFGSGPVQVGPRVPTAGTAPRFSAGGPQQTMASSGTALHPAGMHSPFGSPPATALPSIGQPTPPFSAAQLPPSGSLPFAAPAQGMPPPSGPPFAAQTWPMQPGQVFFLNKN